MGNQSFVRALDEFLDESLVVSMVLVGLSVGWSLAIFFWHLPKEYKLDNSLGAWK